MSPLLQKTARAGYMMAWPVTALVLHHSRRARVLIVSGRKILLQRSSVGHQNWCVPGGGLHRKETPMSAAVREVKEEVGIDLLPEKMQFLGERKVASTRFSPVIRVQAFAVKLPQPIPPIITKKYEVLEAQWFDINQLPENTSKTVHILLEMAKLT